MVEDAIEYARSAKKAELHMHLEGALTPELYLKFAQRNEVSIPFNNVDEIRKQYQFSSLGDFISIYLSAFASLHTEQDYVDLCDDYCSRAIAENIVHAEIFLETQAAKMIGLDFHELMKGCIKSVEKWREKGIKVLLIPTFLRHDPEDEALENLDALEPYYEHITAVGLAANEVGNPPIKFKNVFRRARELGFKLVAHAGEEGPPEYVWQAIDELGVDRIDHGNRAIEDDVLVARIARDKIPLTMCPLSNLHLCVVPEMSAHPLKRFMDAGVVTTVNSDDPAYFGGYLNANFEAIVHALDLSKADVEELIANSHEASFNGH